MTIDIIEDWTDQIHKKVQDSKWEDAVEEWEVDYEERCIAYTLFNGTTLVVYEDLRYEHHIDNEDIHIGSLA